MCSFVPVNLTGESSALSAAPFRTARPRRRPQGPSPLLKRPPSSETAVSVTPEAAPPPRNRLPFPRPCPAAPRRRRCAMPRAGRPPPACCLRRRSGRSLTAPPPGRRVLLDLPADTDAAQAIRWAAQGRLIVGYGDGTFRPDEPVTREADRRDPLPLRGAAQRGHLRCGRSRRMGDGSSVSPWAQQAMLWAVQSGTIAAHGDGTIGAHETATCGALSRC